MDTKPNLIDIQGLLIELLSYNIVIPYSYPREKK